MSGTTEARALAQELCDSLAVSNVSERGVEILGDALARAREEGAREATMRLKLRLEATQMTLGDLWNRVDTFDPRMAPDLEEVVKLALEPNP
jgi:hypothetical protein